METKENDYLIVGLGNPGKSYEKTPHNMGFSVVQSFAEKNHMTFVKNAKIQSKIAKGYVKKKKVYLLLPQTFMNESGRAVQLCMNFYKIDINNILVIVDDIAMPFGRLRMRSKGSSGGHNGLKSIENYLHTQNYARLRIGIELGDERQQLSSYVLDKFTKQREQRLLEIKQEAQRAIEIWLEWGINQAMNQVNVKNKKIEEE